jgi:hypothetical protein
LLAYGTPGEDRHDSRHAKKDHAFHRRES